MSEELVVLPVLLPDIEKITQDFPAFEGEPTENYFFRLLSERMNLEQPIIMEIMACLKAAQYQELNNIMLDAIIKGENIH